MSAEASAGLAALLGWLQQPLATLAGAPLSRAEALGASLGLLMVWGNIRVRAWAWPLAIASSALYGLVFWDARLYADAVLQGVFIAVAAWGWWRWTARPAGGLPPEAAVGRLGAAGRGLALAAWALGTALLAGLLERADAAAAGPDAFVAAGSVVAQVLLVRKRVESWWGWVAVNAVAVGLFLHQGLIPTALLYAVFLAMAVQGGRRWARLACKPAAG